MTRTLFTLPAFVGFALTVAALAQSPTPPPVTAKAGTPAAPA